MIKWYPFIDNLFLRILIYLGLSISVLLAIGFFIASTDYITGKDKKLELRYLEEDLEFVESKDADKQFRMHQRELKRYYNLNIAQVKTVSVLGIILLAIGIIVILSTLLLFANGFVMQITPLVVGCVSGMLIDFIGAFFIVMYTQTINASISFHEKLAASNNLLLGTFYCNENRRQSH